MPIVKQSPSELAIHGGGPAAFDRKLPTFSPHVGDGELFASLAERMFLQSETPGTLVEEWEAALCAHLGRRNVIAFSSRSAAFGAVLFALNVEKVALPAFGHSAFCIPEHVGSQHFDVHPDSFAASGVGDAETLFALQAFGRPHKTRAESAVLYAHQSLGGDVQPARITVYELGRDELVHATDAAVAVTDDDLLAYVVRRARAQKDQGLDLKMSDAAAAMALANLGSLGRFVQGNRLRYELYAEYLEAVQGIKLISPGANYQSVVIEVSPGETGISRDGLHDVLTAENVGTAKPFEGERPLTIAPVAARLQSRLLQLPIGPGATEEAIEAICKLIELAIVRSLESPDPVRLAA